jgi:hypothetical protein
MAMSIIKSTVKTADKEDEGNKTLVILLVEIQIGSH